MPLARHAASFSFALLLEQTSAVKDIWTPDEQGELCRIHGPNESPWKRLNVHRLFRTDTTKAVQVLQIFNSHVESNSTVAPPRMAWLSAWFTTVVWKLRASSRSSCKSIGYAPELCTYMYLLRAWPWLCWSKGGIRLHTTQAERRLAERHIPYLGTQYDQYGSRVVSRCASVEEHTSMAATLPARHRIPPMQSLVTASCPACTNAVNMDLYRRSLHGGAL